MNRRKFIGAAALTAAGAALTTAQETKKENVAHGACGLSCAGCRMQLNGKCAGCGQGPKAACAVFQCVQMKKLSFCAQCKGYPCPKLKEINKFSDAWMKKIGEAPLPQA
ncbi:MAG: DUF3795 domain-containing protein [Lentisphaeria bacterium]|nr:DUF3795 domain-containing protein [Lentisphaeria bacterium]